MQELFPNDKFHQVTEEGIAGHWGAERVLNSYVNADQPLLTTQQLVDTIAPNGIMINDEIADGIDLYVTDILNTIQNERDLTLADLMVEQTVNISRLNPNCEGTPDAYCFNQKTGVLTIWDLKLGYGLVESFENWQMICYAIGILDLLTGGNALADNNHIRVRMRVVQPRVYHKDGSIREWSIPAVELRSYANILIDVFDQALNPNPFCKTGSHCKDCGGLSVCNAAHRAAVNGLDVVDQMNIEVLPANVLKYHRDILKRAVDAAELRLEAIEGQIESLLQSKQTVDGLTLDRLPGRLRWTQADDVIISIGDACGVDLRNIKTVTPTQAKKLIDESVINTYSKRSDGSLKIVNSEDSRAARVFGKSN